MRHLPFLKRARALVVVAHPDDETIWMGGTIARHAHSKWTIVVLCRRSDPDRMPKFQHVMRSYGARGIICDLEDEGIMTVEQSIPAIEIILRKELPSQPREGWDVLFSHGANGEYGHPRHKGVHQAVKHMLTIRALHAKNVFYFAYTLDKEKNIAVPSSSAPYGVRLSQGEWRTKRNVIQKLYGFRPYTFENRSCAKIEAFTLGL